MLSFSFASVGCDQVDALTGQLEELQEGLSETANPADVLALAEQAREQAERAATAAEERMGPAAENGAPDPRDGSPTEQARTANNSPTEAEEETGLETVEANAGARSLGGPRGQHPTPSSAEDPNAAEPRPANRLARAIEARREAARQERDRAAAQPERPSTPNDNPSPASMGSRPSCNDAPDPSQCVIDRYRGRARHAFQLIALADAYNSKGRFSDAVPLIQQLLQRYPTHARADRYRRLLESRGVQPAR